MNSRKIQQILPGRNSRDGDGVRIRRVLGQQQHDLDPFLMLDEIRSDDQADYVGGFPAHPHRGIETLTYMLSGGFIHEDNFGHRAELRNGGAQWMSTGSGIIHSEMPLIHDGLLHGFQLWINLPAAQKMKAPEYRQAVAGELPTLSLASGGSARVFGGSWTVDGTLLRSPLDSLAAGARTLDLQLPAGASLNLALPAQDTLLAYVYEGMLATGLPIQPGQLVRFSEGEQVSLTAGAEGVRLLLLAGTPLGEPIVQHGPFVMDSEAEIQQAIADYRNGILGQPPQNPEGATP
ncbi:pirin family protein [Pseudomonas sp. N040]|uniref:pirin family protein n=1 Tax=Pseudomonas sp. N040 TaxID=2785325 RepID=UPI0018A27BD3|nr:pirin family protein [Pseudomonas sp. N040]MBF7729807.1 pirin family protein [Pseudomonas sp. N040]MBW7013449.1 pirin family protein [Pseudomonas sp. N040]